LAQALTREAIPFTPFVTLNDVADTLEAAWSVAVPATLPRSEQAGTLITPRSA
jgi:hypothetical protein